MGFMRSSRRVLINKHNLLRCLIFRIVKFVIYILFHTILMNKFYTKITILKLRLQPVDKGLLHWIFGLKLEIYLLLNYLNYKAST